MPPCDLVHKQTIDAGTRKFALAIPFGMAERDDCGTHRGCLL